MSRVSLTRARALAAPFLTDTVEVVAISDPVSEPGGGIAPPTETVVATVLGRIVGERVVPRETTAGAIPRAVTVWTIYLPHGTVLTPGHRLRANGETFDVNDDDDARTDGVYLVVNARLVR